MKIIKTLGMAAVVALGLSACAGAQKEPAQAAAPAAEAEAPAEEAAAEAPAEAAAEAPAEGEGGAEN